jgi:hypothetical protein
VVNFGGIGDILPFVPWVAFWAAWLVDAISRVRVRYAPTLAAVSAIVLIAYGQHTLFDQTTLQEPTPSLSFQRQQVREIEKSALVGAGDAIYVTNLAWFLLLGERDNLTQYNFLWSGVPEFVNAEEGSYEPITGVIARREPKLVVLGFRPETHVREAAQQGYRQIAPSSLPSYFANRAEFWVREELTAAGATAELLPRQSDLHAFCDRAIDWSAAGRSAGDLVSVVGPVVAVRPGRTGSTALQLGEPGKFSAILTPRAVAGLGEPPERAYAGNTVCVRGVVDPVLGIPTISVDDTSLIVLLDAASEGRTP